MFNHKIIHSRYRKDGCTVIIEKTTLIPDHWSTEEWWKYRVFIKDYTNGYMYSMRTTDSLLEAHVLFIDLLK